MYLCVLPQPLEHGGALGVGLLFSGGDGLVLGLGPLVETNTAGEGERRREKVREGGRRWEKAGEGGRRRWEGEGRR